ncbi:MAG TPA: hypothetical protein VFJ96_15040 [Gemmatimonadaceae bacterium]|jgi:hypothetical protein|nr:hypothetical protein [Gemmatimonadaceae bacterium]
MRTLTIAASLLVLTTLAGCKKTGEGQYQVTTPDVSVSKDTHTVNTPTVDVKKDTHTVVTPKVEIKKPKGDTGRKL